MRHASGLSATIASLLMFVACGGGRGTGDQAADSANSAANNPLLNSDVRPQPVSVTGCLTASNGRFVVTALDATAAVPTTVAYQLTGGRESELGKQINREVHVAGEADAPKVADVRDIGTPAVGTSGRRTEPDSTGRPQPEVSTQQAMRFQVRTLKVSSVTPTGDECPAGHPNDRQQ